MNPIVTAQHLKKTYHNGHVEVPVLTDVTFTIEKGSFTAIMGKSGCGKSTLLHILGGLLPAEEGSLLVAGQNLLSFSAKQREAYRRDAIGFVFQFFNLLYEQTVLENILLPFQIQQKQADASFLEEILMKLELQQLSDKLPDALSGGEQQKTAIARALLKKPQLLLADEPTGNLDRLSAKHVLELMKQCQRQYAQTILLVTHDMDIAKQCDRILYMEDGIVIPYEAT